MVLTRAAVRSDRTLAAVVTFLAQRRRQRGRDARRAPLFRLQNAIVTYASYLWSLLWPTGLAVFSPYAARSPRSQRRWPSDRADGSRVADAAGTGYLLVGWLVPPGTLVPVIGIVKTGDQAMADRFAYLPRSAG